MKLEAAMYRHQSLCCICYTDKKKLLKKTRQSKNTTDVKGEVFFFPAVFFYAVAKGVVFFNVSLWLLTVMQCSGRASAPLWTQKQIQVTLFTFLSKGFQRWNYILLFFLSELYYCSSLNYILQIKLWYCFNSLFCLLLFLPDVLLHFKKLRHPLCIEFIEFIYLIIYSF